MPAPENWQQQVMEAVAEYRKTGPVFGILLPLSWRPQLSDFVREGQVQRMIGIKRVGFEKGVEKITRIIDPKEQSPEPEKTEKKKTK
jgi:hypothetical protein